MHPLAHAAFALILTASVVCSAPEDPFAYLDNSTIRIGVDKSRGSAIGYLALSKVKRNLLNHHDEGRFIQLSYKEDRNAPRPPVPFM